MTPTKHRHVWVAGSVVKGQVGRKYAWSTCACGERRVETLSVGGNVLDRRYLKPRERQPASLP